MFTTAFTRASVLIISCIFIWLTSGLLSWLATKVMYAEGRFVMMWSHIFMQHISWNVACHKQKLIYKSKWSARLGRHYFVDCVCSVHVSISESVNGKADDSIFVLLCPYVDPTVMYFDTKWLIYRTTLTWHACCGPAVTLSATKNLSFVYVSLD
jgi:hypothetical protein